jgi:hypothetical protein
MYWNSTFIMASMYCLSEWSGITKAIECCLNAWICPISDPCMLQTIPRINRETYVIASPLYRWVQLAKSVLEDGLNVREDDFRTRTTIIVCVERSSFPRPATFVWRFFRYMERLREGTRVSWIQKSICYLLTTHLVREECL